MSKPKREYIKVLRSQVMITARQMGWDKPFLNDMMEEWGFGTSLRKLSIGELKDILRILKGQLDPANLTFSIGALDEQGKYMYSLMKTAGWTALRLRSWWLARMSASHWKSLTDTEKRSTIAMLKTYIANDDNKNTGEKHETDQ